MEVNKENITKKKVTTKIPLPKKHLPQLPDRLLCDKEAENNFPKISDRKPLKTLNALNQPSCSDISPMITQLDSKHVTLRNMNESPLLDWINFIVFKKDVQKSKINELEFDSKVLKPITLTPCSSLEPNRVRNIKKSLKRPHSRELQGLSPVLHDSGKKYEAKRRLHFSGSTGKLRTPQRLSLDNTDLLVKDYTTDIILHLLSVERQPFGTARVPNITRACVVNWLIKINRDGDPSVVQTACWYFDSVLAIEQLHVERLQVFGAACYWLAQKHCSSACCARRLVTQAADAFTPAELKATEQTVLSKLNFPTKPVIVHDFVTYLCWWCDPKSYGELEAAANFLSLAAMLADKWLASELPSVLAAAAVTTALKLLHKRDVLIRLNSCPVLNKTEVKMRLEYVCNRIRRAARLMASSRCDYRAPYEYYSQPPYYIALKLTQAYKTTGDRDVHNKKPTNSLKHLL